MKHDYSAPVTTVVLTNISEPLLSESIGYGGPGQPDASGEARKQYNWQEDTDDTE